MKILGIIIVILVILLIRWIGKEVKTAREQEDRIFDNKEIEKD